MSPPDAHEAVPLLREQKAQRAGGGHVSSGDAGFDGAGVLHRTNAASFEARPPPAHYKPAQLLTGHALYRADVQISLVALICFCCPGMFNAITSMAGGIDPIIVSRATAALYLCATVSSLLAPGVVNMVGARASVFLGTLGYVCYGLSLLNYDHGHVSRHKGALVVLAGAACGISAGLLWTAQGQLVMSYPTQYLKGRYQALFWCIFNLGAVMGGFITFGANLRSEAKDPSLATYWTFVAVMVGGAFLSCLLRKPHEVVRADGSLVVLEKMPNWRGEARGILQVILERRMWALMPLFIYSNWFYTYEFAVYNAGIYNTRTQGLNNSLFWGAQLVGAILIGSYLDRMRISTRRRALMSLMLQTVLVLCNWSLASWASISLRLGENSEVSPPIDFKDGGRYASTASIYTFFGLCDALVQCWTYWLLGHLSSDPVTLSRYAGFFKFCQCGGAAIAWAINGSHVNPTVQLVTNVVLFVVALPGAAFVCNSLGSADHELIQ